jgi:hypothetical protein
VSSCFFLLATDAARTDSRAAASCRSCSSLAISFSFSSYKQGVNGKITIFGDLPTKYENPAHAILNKLFTAGFKTTFCGLELTKWNIFTLKIPICPFGMFCGDLVYYSLFWYEKI